ncbi:MAG: trigger factor [Firmicutes bacterium]|nr:trigger factor [Bacillota bacterium]
MQANVERLDKTRVAIQVGFGPEEVAEAIDKAYRRVAQRIKVPGFRPGKAPRAVLEARYGRGIFYEEALEILVPSAYQEALRLHDLEPIDEPEMEIVEPLEEGKPFIFKATVRVLPPVELGEYKGLRIEKPVPRIEEEEVRRRLEDLREDYAELVPAGHEELAAGDFAVVDLEGYVDGRPLPESSQNGYTFELKPGSPFPLPGLAEGILGMRVGETRTVTIRLPEDHYQEEFAGKEAEFRVVLQAIKQKELPDLDDEFAKSLGAESLAHMEESIRTGLRRVAEREAERVFRERLLKKVVENARIEEIPAVLVERAVERRYRRLLSWWEERGISHEKYLAHLGKTENEIKEEMRPAAEWEVREDLVLDAIAKAEGIEPSEEEINQRLAELAAALKIKEVDQLRATFAADGRLSALTWAIRREKAVKFLAEKAEALPEPEPEKG